MLVVCLAVGLVSGACLALSLVLARRRAGGSPASRELERLGARGLCLVPVDRALAERMLEFGRPCRIRFRPDERHAPLLFHMEAVGAEDESLAP